LIIIRHQEHSSQKNTWHCWATTTSLVQGDMIWNLKLPVPLLLLYLLPQKSLIYSKYTIVSENSRKRRKNLKIWDIPETEITTSNENIKSLWNKQDLYFKNMLFYFNHDMRQKGEKGLQTLSKKTWTISKRDVISNEFIF